MKSVEVDQVIYYMFENLIEKGVSHAIFSRHGGVSPEPWKSLNMGATVGDDLERVKENRNRAFTILGRNTESIFDVWQVHSSDVICTNSPRPSNALHQKADAIITDKSDVTLFMRFADCVPIMLYDQRLKVIGLVHAGWLGTINKVVEKAIDQMKLVYHCNPGDIIAGIGPSIGPDHYEVGSNVIEGAEKSFGRMAGEILRSINGSVHFDLWEANRLLLLRSGVRNIELSGICTACHIDDWFSHRGEYGKTGRFGAMIGLNI
jgi:hypothetical protein